MNRLQFASLACALAAAFALGGCSKTGDGTTPSTTTGTTPSTTTSPMAPASAASR